MSNPHHGHVFDQLDLGMLRLLSEDGRMSFTDIAKELDVSVGTVRNRYNRLHKEGILHVLCWIDPVSAGYNAYARVTIEVRPTERILGVSEALLRIPEVSFVAITSGPHDLEINLVCRNNQHLLDLMHHQVHRIDGVHETHTTIYFRVLKWASSVLARPDVGSGEAGSGKSRPGGAVSGESASVDRNVNGLPR